MIELASVREEIAAPAAAIWRMLSDFAHPERLAPTIDRAELRGEGIGAVRIVHSSRGLTIHEELIECDPAAYRFRYAILDAGDMPFAGVTSYRCTVVLLPRGDRPTEIHWCSEGTVDGPPAPVRAFLTTLYRNANAQIARELGAAVVGRMIDRVLADAVEQKVVAGLVGIVADANGELYSAAHGVRTASGSVPMTRDTIFWLASLTKLVTTVAALQLVADGRLALDAPVADLLPELAAPQVLDGFDAAGAPVLRAARGAITLRHLLTHRSGLGYDLMTPALLRARGAAGPPPATSLSSLEGPLLFDPGEGWTYGVGIDWAGLAVERASGQTLDRYLADHVFAPLGMADTGFGSHAAAADRVAETHLRQPDGGVLPVPSLMAPPEEWAFHSGGGGLSGTAPDYVRLLRMLLGGGALDGVRVLPADMVDAMWDDQSGGFAAGCVDTAMPTLCLPYDPLPGQRGAWNLLGVRNADHVPGRRRAGSASWVGVAGTFFWIDRASGLCGVLMAQLLPFADAALTRVREEFEAAVYAEFVTPS